MAKVLEERDPKSHLFSLWSQSTGDGAHWDEDEQDQAQPTTSYVAVSHFCSAAVAIGCYLVIIMIHVVQNHFLCMYLSQELCWVPCKGLYFGLAKGAKGTGMRVKEAGMEEDAPNQLLFNSLKSSIFSMPHSAPSWHETNSSTVSHCACRAQTGPNPTRTARPQRGGEDKLAPVRQHVAIYPAPSHVQSLPDVAGLYKQRDDKDD